MGAQVTILGRMAIEQPDPQRAADAAADDEVHGEPDDTAVYELYQHGHERLRAGHPRAAVEVLELAVEREPQKASLHEALGRAYFATASLGRAQAAFERTLELDPSNDYAHFALGRCFERQGRTAEAAKHLKIALALKEHADYRAALERVQARQDADRG